MKLEETMRTLEKAGTAQNRKVYARHGVGKAMFGVNYANQRALAKKIGTDHGLAEALWATGNHDARVLATMIADPEAMAPTRLEKWGRELDNYVVADAFASFAARTPGARRQMEKWIRSKGEWTARAGWDVVCRLAMNDAKTGDAYYEKLLATIEQGIHKAENRARHAMYMALISIGGRSAELKESALATAKRIGKVEVDHGETGCKTPDAAPYIERMWARKVKQKTVK